MLMLLESCQNSQLINKWGVKNYYLGTSIVNFGLQLHLLKKNSIWFCDHTMHSVTHILHHTIFIT